MMKEAAGLVWYLMHCEVGIINLLFQIYAQEYQKNCLITIEDIFQSNRKKIQFNWNNY